MEAVLTPAVDVKTDVVGRTLNGTPYRTPTRERKQRKMNVPSTPLGLPNPSLCCTQRRRSGPLAFVRSLSLCLVEARPVVQVIFLARFVCAALPGPFSGRVALGAVSWLFAVLAVYLANGVTDIVEDRHNGSTRPIASGALDVGFARQVIVASAPTTAIQQDMAMPNTPTCTTSWPPEASRPPR